MAQPSIAFIGGGNMASSLVGGLVADGYPTASLRVAEPDEARRNRLSARFGVHVTADNQEAARHADIVLFAVKPQILADVARGLAATVREANPLVISVAAGVREGDLARWLGGERAIVRVMPNTPALLGAGASALYANAHVGAEARSRAESILRAVGLTVWIEDERLMDTVTALSGSGPAYFFLFMECLEEAAHRFGMPRDTARLLTLQTAFGAAKMAFESEDDPATLRANVTSPGGTTERAIEAFRHGGLEQLVHHAVRAARDRSAELGDMLGEQ